MINRIRRAITFSGTTGKGLYIRHALTVQGVKYAPKWDSAQGRHTPTPVTGYYIIIKFIFLDVFTGYRSGSYSNYTVYLLYDLLC